MYPSSKYGTVDGRTKNSLPPQLRDFTHIDRVRAVNLPQAIGFADKSLECEHCHEKGHRASQCNWSGSVVRGQDGRQYRTGGRFGGQFCFCCFGHGHIAQECRYRHPNSIGNKACYYCGESERLPNGKEHTLRACIKFRLGKGEVLRDGFEKAERCLSRDAIPTKGPSGREAAMYRGRSWQWRTQGKDGQYYY